MSFPQVNTVVQPGSQPGSRTFPALWESLVSTPGPQPPSMELHKSILPDSWNLFKWIQTVSFLHRVICEARPVVSGGGLCVFSAVHHSAVQVSLHCWWTFGGVSSLFAVTNDVPKDVMVLVFWWDMYACLLGCYLGGKLLWPRVYVGIASVDPDT